MTRTPPDRPELAAARRMLERMGISPADLLDVAPAITCRPPRWWGGPVRVAGDSTGRSSPVLRRCVVQPGEASRRGEGFTLPALP